MSTGRKWFLALALVSGLYFLMIAFPTKVDVAVHGDDVWLVPGFSGNVVLDTGLKRAVANHWSGSLTLTLTRDDGSTVSVGRAQHAQDWDSTISVKQTLGTKAPLTVGVHAAVPRSLSEGTRLSGTLKGDLVTPEYYQGGFINHAVKVDRSLVVHVAGQGEVTDHAEGTAHWPLPGWMKWLLWLPMALFVATSAPVRSRIGA